MRQRHVSQGKCRRSAPQWRQQTRKMRAARRLARYAKRHASKSESFIAPCASRGLPWLMWLPVGLVGLAVGLMLTGCASGTPPTLAQPHPCPASLTVACPTPPPARSGSLADLLDNHIEAMELAAQCRDQLNKLARCANE